MVGRIATCEIEEAPENNGKDKAAQAMGRKRGKARAANTTPEQRAEIARKVAASRWKKMNTAA